MLQDDLRNLRIGFTVVSLAIWLALIIGSTGHDTVVVLDWVVCGNLAFWFPLFTAIPELSTMLFRIYVKSSIQKLNATLDRYTHRSASEEGERHIQDRLDLLGSAYRAKVAWVSLSGRNWRDRALRDFLDRETKYISGLPDESPYRARLAFSDTKRLEQFDTAAILDEIEELGRTRQYNDDEMKEARHQIQQGLLEVAKLQQLQHILDTDTRASRENLAKEYISIDFLLLGFAAFLCVLPWLYFRGLHRGTKPSCDIKMVAFFVPVSISNTKWIKFMKVLSILLTLVATTCVRISLRLLWKGIRQGYVSEQGGQAGPEGDDDGDSFSAPRTNPPELLPETICEAPRARGGGKYESRESAHESHEGGSASNEEQEQAGERVSRLVATLPNILKINYAICALGAFIVCIIAIVNTEVILKVNHVHVSAVTGGQLIAWFIGAAQLAMVCWHSTQKVRNDKARILIDSICYYSIAIRSPHPSAAFSRHANV